MCMLKFHINCNISWYNYKCNIYLLVRSIPDEEYLATVDDESTGCVTCLACTESDKDGVTFCRWCTGGNELKVWDQLPLGKVKKRTR